MVIFILTFLMICLAMLGMSVGVLFAGRPIRGGCHKCSRHCEMGREVE